MLRECALKHGGSWDKSLPYAEFAYNNSYQSSLKMTPFEALYGRKCRTPMFWNQTRESQLFGLEIIKEAERQDEIIRENLKIAQSRQKSYADPKSREVIFEVGDYAYLRVSLSEVFEDLISEGSYHPALLDLFKSWKDEVK
jgi:hypothetical protein